QLLDRALAIREKNFGPNHLELAPTLSDLAVLRYFQHQNAEAEALYKRSLAIWNRSGETRSTNFGLSLQNLGELYLKEHRYDEAGPLFAQALRAVPPRDRKSTRLNSSHQIISYAVFCLKKKNAEENRGPTAFPNSSPPR